MAENVYRTQGRAGMPPTMTRGQMRASLAKAETDVRRGNPDLNYGLGVAKVVNIDYEGMLVTLRTVIGTSQTYERVPVPLTFPGAGARHFLGALPMIGDFCVVGWSPQESSEPGGGTKNPIILSWILPGVWPGHDWLTTVDVEQDEHDLTPGELSFLSGAYDKIRHKLRHMSPGNIVGSSAQGSDLVLDESVTLANRRGNELRLRDQDQALVVRSLQQFHAMAGARIYGGMVQRDATFLPVKMVSDGQIWDGGTQANSDGPITDQNLNPDPNAPPGFLTPTRMFQKAWLPDTSQVGQSLLTEDPYIDPYIFLRNGGFINEQGFVTDDKYISDAGYGGKSIFRVSSQDSTNAALHPEAKTLTEYRIEVTHTSDGTLPVTEQTDGLDSDRLPDKDSSQPANGLASNAPFIEVVYGSVVGNDPFTVDGRRKYGLPLQALVFDGDAANPRLEPAILATQGSGLTPTPLKDHLAALFKLTPPFDEGETQGTFVGYTKQGQLRASIGGDPEGNSVEAWLAGGLKFGVGGAFQLLLNDHFEIGTTGHNSIGLRAEEGAVRIFGGGPVKTGETEVESSIGTGRGAQDLPAVDIEARTNARIKADRQVLVKGNDVVLDGTTTTIWGHETVEINGTRKLSLSAETFQKAIGGKAVETYMGPKYSLPTNFPLHERTYAPTLPGTAEQVTYKLGDRVEKFQLGSHSTTVQIGDMTYQLNAGTWKATAVTASLQMDTTGITGRATFGNVSLTAAAGAASMTGLTSASLVATGGLASVRGSLGVVLAAPALSVDVGGVLCAGTLEPFTGLPYATFGCGSRTVNVIGT